MDHVGSKGAVLSNRNTPEVCGQLRRMVPSRHGVASAAISAAQASGGPVPATVGKGAVEAPLKRTGSRKLQLDVQAVGRSRGHATPVVQTSAGVGRTLLYRAGPGRR